MLAQFKRFLLRSSVGFLTERSIDFLLESCPEAAWQEAFTCELRGPWCGKSLGTTGNSSKNILLNKCTFSFTGHTPCLFLQFTIHHVTRWDLAHCLPPPPPARALRSAHWLARQYKVPQWSAHWLLLLLLLCHTHWFTGWLNKTKNTRIYIYKKLYRYFPVLFLYNPLLV